MFAVFFVLAAVAGLAGIALVDWRAVPPVLGTGALILTIVALGVAMYR